MKWFLQISALVAVLLAALLWLGDPPREQQALRDLPWQIELLPDGSTKVLGIHLGNSSLADVVSRYGSPEGLSLFMDKHGALSLEAYFASVSSGPLKAKLVVALEAAQSELEVMASNALLRTPAADGSYRLLLNDSDKSAQGLRRVKALTYIPSYANLDADFFRPRFGEPTDWERINEHAVRWFYPDKGLSILMDTEGNEILQYGQPLSKIQKKPQ